MIRLESQVESHTLWLLTKDCLLSGCKDKDAPGEHGHGHGAMTEMGPIRSSGIFIIIYCIHTTAIGSQPSK